MEALSDAERLLDSSIQSNTPCDTGQIKDKKIRSEFLRHRILQQNRTCTISIVDAHVTGQIDFTNCKIQAGLAFDKCTFDEPINIENSELTALFIIRSNINGISGRNAKIEGDLRLTSSTSLSGINLPIAKIEGSLVCRGLWVTATEKDDFDAFLADGINIKGDAFFNYDEKDRIFKSTGTLRLIGAYIGGDLDLQFAEITAGYIASYESEKDMAALYAERAIIKGSVQLQQSSILGINAVSFANTEIGGDFDASGAKFTTERRLDLSKDWHEWPRSLYLQHARILGSARLHGIPNLSDSRPPKEFSCPSAIDMRNSFIKGDLELRSRAGETQIGALIMLGAKIEGALNAYKGVVLGHLDARNAQVAVLIDHPDCWPPAGQLKLDYFEYNRFGSISPTDLSTRLSWLRRQSLDYLGRNFKPYPFEQLSKVLKQMGHESEARVILIEKQRYLRESGRIGGLFAKLIHKLLGALVGYGYRPLKALIAASIVVTAGWVFFQVGHDHGYIAPTKTRMVLSTPITDYDPSVSLPSLYPAFDALAYSIDSFLPVLDLQQETYWVPRQINSSGEKDNFYRIYYWIHTMLGWLITTIAIAGFTGLIKRD